MNWCRIGFIWWMLLCFPLLHIHQQEQYEVYVIFGFHFPIFITGIMDYFQLGESSTRGNRIRCLGRFIDVRVIGFIVFQMILHLVWYCSRMYYFSLSGKLQKSGILKCSVKAMGLHAMLCCIQLYFPAIRNVFCMKMINLSYEQSIQYHKWLGYGMCGFLLIHSIGYNVIWWKEGKWSTKAIPCRHCTTKRQYKSMRNFCGQLATICCIVLLILSLSCVRKKRYQLFYWSHLVLSMIVVILVCLHYEHFAIWMFPGLMLFALQYCISCFQRQMAVIQKVQIINQKYLRLYFYNPTFQFHPGQFIYMKIPQISSYQWHPFSISSSPLHQNYFTIDIKVNTSMTSFTSQVLRFAQQSRLKAVHLDGMYGLSDQMDLTQSMCFVAGGIGATTLLSMLDHCIELADTNCLSNITFIWVCSDLGLFRLNDTLFQRARELQIKVQLYYTGSTTHAEILSYPLEFQQSMSFMWKDSMNKYFYCYYLVLTSGLVIILYQVFTMTWYISRVVIPLMIFCTSIFNILLHACIQNYTTTSYESIPSEELMEWKTEPLTYLKGRPNFLEILNNTHESPLYLYISGPESLIHTVITSCDSLSDQNIAISIKTYTI